MNEQVRAPARRGVRVADGGDIDAHELELGAHVGAGEIALPRSPCNCRGDDVSPSGSRARPGRRFFRSTARIRRWRRCPGRRCGRRRRSRCRRARRPPDLRPCASSSRGRMPAENTIRSVSSSLPSANRMRCACASPSAISIVVLAGVDADAELGDARRSTRPAASSICTAIRRGANSTTCVSSPRSLSAFAASRPSRSAADDHTVLACVLALADGLQILDRAVDEAAGAIAARECGGTKG